MTCPRGCGIHLAITERMGIEIDYCPQCRGIWLDRGELEKLIAKFREEEALLEKAAQPNPVPMPEPRPQAQPQAPYQPQPQQYDRRYDDRDRYDKKYRKDYDDDIYYRDEHGNLRKRSWFERLIDAID
ncbi:MAG: zf-TFIIB domain-containing protein [Fimbriimonadaceae bacterium]